MHKTLPLLTVLLFGCPTATDTDAETDNPTAEALEIIGTYIDDFDTDHDITADTWTMSSSFGTSTFDILDFDNAAMFVIAQNGTDNEFNADLYSRMDWTMAGGVLYFCQTVFDGADEQAARDAARSDDTDLTMGCGGFAWSMLN